MEKVRIKALALNKRSQKIEWYEDVWSNGDDVYFETPKCGLKKLKDPLQIWVTLGTDREYICVLDTGVSSPYPKDCSYTSTLFTLSTAHMTEVDSNLIKSGCVESLISADYDEGTFFYKPENIEEGITLLKEQGFSEIFIEMYHYVFEIKKADMLRLDSFGDEVKGLRTHSWQ